VLFLPAFLCFVEWEPVEAGDIVVAVEAFDVVVVVEDFDVVVVVEDFDVVVVVEAAVSAGAALAPSRKATPNERRPSATNVESVFFISVCSLLRCFSGRLCEVNGFRF
jgi:hypothetical protein